MPSDPIHDKPFYPSDNAWGIPTLRYPTLPALPTQLVRYREKIEAEQAATSAVHFFMFDGLFESVWRCLSKSQRYLRQFKTLLTPDFSLNADSPLAVQVWNTYRNRWCGAHWQTLGYTIIPTVSWSTPASYPFCFLGIPQHSPVALTTLGGRSPEQRAVFLHGFVAMVEQLQPRVVLCYGTPLPEMERVPLQVYPDHWQRRKHGR